MFARAKFSSRPATRVIDVGRRRLSLALLPAEHDSAQGILTRTLAIVRDILILR